MEEATKPKPKARQRIERIAFVVLFLLLAASGAITSVAVLGRSVYAWRGFEIELRVLPANRGQTRLVFTPLGEVAARTHDAPIELVAALKQIQLDEIQKLVAASPTQKALVKELEGTARRGLIDFALRQLAFAAFGGLLAPLLLRSRRFRHYIVGCSVGVLLVAGSMGSAVASFNGKAFEKPEYTGVLKQAPQIIAFGQDAFSRFEELGTKLQVAATNLNTLYGRIASLPSTPFSAEDTNTFRVLHISDIHNNAAALEFVRSVAKQFQVSFIVDTGDLTDFGSVPETSFMQEIGRIGFRYIFVAGNHDSRTLTQALAKLPNVTVLDGQSTEVEGLLLVGLSNPLSRMTVTTPGGDRQFNATPEEWQANAAHLSQIVKALPRVPDIVAIHDPKEAGPLWGSVPLVLCGHMHRFYVETQTAPPGAPPAPAPANRTILCNAGTTGAAGTRYFDQPQGVPFSCAVLTFRRAIPPPPTAPALSPPPKGTPGTSEPSPSITAAKTPTPPPALVSIDLVSLSGSFGEYTITRYPFQSAPTATPALPLPPKDNAERISPSPRS